MTERLVHGIESCMNNTGSSETKNDKERMVTWALSTLQNEYNNDHKITILMTTTKSSLKTIQSITSFT